MHKKLYFKSWLFGVGNPIPYDVKDSVLETIDPGPVVYTENSSPSPCSNHLSTVRTFCKRQFPKLLALQNSNLHNPSPFARASKLSLASGFVRIIANFCWITSMCSFLLSIADPKADVSFIQLRLSSSMVIGSLTYLYKVKTVSWSHTRSEATRQTLPHFCSWSCVTETVRRCKMLNWYNW